MSVAIDGSLNPTGNTAVVTVADLEVGDVVRYCKANVGGVYVPPGTYRVSEPLNFDGSARSFQFFGDGGISKIIGDFDDFVIKRQFTTPTASGHGGTRRIERLHIENEHATGGGIRLANCVGGAIHDCTIVANRGINTMNQDTLEVGVSWGSFEMIVSNCDLSPGANVVDSIGLCLFHDGPTLNCRVIGFAKGWIHMGGQGGQIVAGCWFELCDHGCWGSIIPDESNSPRSLMP